MRVILFSLLLSVFLFACKNRSAKKDIPPAPAPDSLVKADQRIKDSTLRSLTHTILIAFKSKSYDTLGSFIHPDYGIRFSPYAYVDTINDRQLSAANFLKEIKTKKQSSKIWGQFDGSGEPIKMTINEYLGTFVYDVDFASPEKIKVDTLIGTGNSMSNISEVYKGSNFTESHFSGFDKKFEGMDWRSLRLVFQLKNGKYYLVGVVHDQWTT